MQHFDNNIINLSKEKNKDNFLFCLVKSIINLTNSPVYKGRILIGGLYHKKYYSIIKKAFKNEKNRHINQCGTRGRNGRGSGLPCGFGQ